LWWGCGGGRRKREEIEKEEEIQGRGKKRFGFLFFKLTLFAWVGKIATCLNFRD
jgi:hypothetical protein